MAEWRDISNEQNLRLAQKMLEQAGELNEALAEVKRLQGDVGSVLGIVSDWCVEANENGGVDAGDLAWRLEQAGYPLPDPAPEPIENFVGIFPEGWTDGLDSAAWVRKQRDKAGHAPADEPSIVIHLSEACEGAVKGLACADCEDGDCEHECHQAAPAPTEGTPMASDPAPETAGRGPRCPDCGGWLHIMAEDYHDSVSIQAQCVRCPYVWDNACSAAIHWEYAQVRKLREQGLKEPEWQPMKAGTGQALQRYPRAPYKDCYPTQVSTETGDTHAFQQQADVSVRVCQCGKWPLHHVHTGSRAACTCDACHTPADTTGDTP